MAIILIVALPCLTSEDGGEGHVAIEDLVSTVDLFTPEDVFFEQQVRSSS